MKITALLAPLFVLVALTLTAAAPDAPTTVTLSDVHLCCGKCVKGINTAVTPVAGAAAVCDTTADTVVLTAPDKDTLQKAVNAIVAAGYFGKSSDSSIKVDAATGAPDGNVTTLDITGVHNCCASCAKDLNAALANVPGITSGPIAANASAFTITGNFNAKALFDELQKAGFTGTVAPAK
jgi:copper chaperone CopZ